MSCGEKSASVARQILLVPKRLAMSFMNPLNHPTEARNKDEIIQESSEEKPLV